LGSSFLWGGEVSIVMKEQWRVGREINLKRAGWALNVEMGELFYKGRKLILRRNRGPSQTEGKKGT